MKSSNARAIKEILKAIKVFAPHKVRAPMLLEDVEGALGIMMRFLDAYRRDQKFQVSYELFLALREVAFDVSSLRYRRLPPDVKTTYNVYFLECLHSFDRWLDRKQGEITDILKIAETGKLPWPKVVEKYESIFGESDWDSKEDLVTAMVFDLYRKKTIEKLENMSRGRPK